MIRGPLEYVPPVEVEVVTKRKAIPLDENEGIYVRDIKTGKVRGLEEGCGEGGWIGGGVWRGRVDRRRGVEEG